MNVIGLDVGGANIKMSDADGTIVSRPFPIWKQKERLAEVLQELVAEVYPSPDLVAVTMTAELADCFSTKAEGVEFVISTIEACFPKSLIRIWLTSGEFAAPEDARDLPTLVAAANWHALATWAGRAISTGPAVLIDVGSTTTDIIPMLDGFPANAGLNDVERLLASELVYTGSLRTPVCAVVHSVPFRGQQCPVAAEMFASVADGWVVAGLRPEDASCLETADGRPLTLDASRNRLAHMLCCDATELHEEELEQIAQAIVTAQSQQIADAVNVVVARLSSLMSDQQRSMETERPVVLVTGSGSFVVQHVLNHFLATDTFSDRLLVSGMFRNTVAECACAFAVARLAHDRCSDDLLETHLF